MKILIVGGTGMIGAHTALHLRDQGNDVTIAARAQMTAESPVADFPILIGDYTLPSLTPEQLSGFDGIVFAAGQDVRHKNSNADDSQFWEKTQSGGVPRFAALAKQAGVPRFVQVGSYYHHLRPDLAVGNPYITARQAADEGARALADDSFIVSTLNPPSIIGVVPGASVNRYRRMVSWAAGNELDIPDFAPVGGTNYMSARSLAEAVWGALRSAKTGSAYLVGDQNLRYREFFQMLVDAAGSSRMIEERNEEHPLLPDNAIIQGRGNALSYEPDAENLCLLSYTRNDCARAVQELVDTVRAAG
ncbi:NAD(P)-dependent oxidoreductase [Paeniglutamicibacter sp. Y32M11]|uniref:NAD-dependent epimerase/dehydratase family protein n=1 Tax=Paeniglutamicibacter sp. Y32M11 TaxID=2853258 RepID=UPI001C532952|nr:NAD(P)-dependent oxidoreductase [Paeniglutamicibacter sp. Y32M11]QXQ10289.1 NAD(P)-dependent oxidoreductase [Paeniglutamicibacter sp. Y32M11]